MVEPTHVWWTEGGPVISRRPLARAKASGERETASVADATILGLWAFAVGTWMLAVVAGGILPASEITSMAPPVLFIAGLAQFIAGLVSFTRFNMVAATAFTAFGAEHVTGGTIFLLHGAGIVHDGFAMHTMLAYLGLSFGFIAFGLMLAVLFINVPFILITGTTFIGSVLLGVVQLHGGPAAAPAVARAGGAVLLFDAGVAFYLGAALLVNSAWGRQILPIFGKA